MATNVLCICTLNNYLQMVKDDFFCKRFSIPTQKTFIWSFFKKSKNIFMPALSDHCYVTEPRYVHYMLFPMVKGMQAQLGQLVDRKSSLITIKTEGFRCSNRLSDYEYIRFASPDLCVLLLDLYQEFF